uniref:Rad21/Rec8-like protein C-terminal eukaryotic domain-containing protein n=1 Tax=Pelusios castaneus TaxID=367368 RepID=A0A8C8R658_9SAUR
MLNYKCCLQIALRIMALRLEEKVYRQSLKLKTQEKREKLQELVRNDQDNEDKRWRKRSLRILNTLRCINQSGVNSVSFWGLCKNSDRKQVAAKFYSFLVLKKQLAIELTQPAPYADIIATVGPKFYTI